MNVVIIGAGAFGKALGKILVDNGHAIAYFDKKHEHPTLAEAVEGADVMVLAIPSKVVSEFTKTLSADLRKMPVISAAKGLLDLSCFDGYARVSILSGPAFAVDIMNELPVTFTVTDEIAKTLFENERVVIELVDDALGVALCGSLKNIYAIGAGALPEASDDINDYLERALAETRHYLKNHGAKSTTADLACGIGDLVMTATNEKSRNLRCGKRLLKGYSLDDVYNELGTVEGLEALKQVDREGYPIIKKIYELVYGDEI